MVIGKRCYLNLIGMRRFCSVFLDIGGAGKWQLLILVFGFWFFSKKKKIIPMKIYLAFIWGIVYFWFLQNGRWMVTVLCGAVIMVFCFQNCSDLLWEKIVLVIEKIFSNSRLGWEFAKILRSREQFIQTVN